MPPFLNLRHPGGCGEVRAIPNPPPIAPFQMLVDCELGSLRSPPGTAGLPRTASCPAAGTLRERSRSSYEPKRAVPRLNRQRQPSWLDRGSGCPALSTIGPTSSPTGAAVGCELFVWLDRPVPTAIATAPHQSYGSTVDRRLQAHRSERRAETTLVRNGEPNGGIGHWLAFGVERYTCTAGLTVRAIPYRSRSRRRWRWACRSAMCCRNLSRCAA